MLDWLRMAGDVMNAYGEVLKKYPKSVVDVSVLPLSKTNMKILLKALYKNSSSEEQRECIEDYFKRLCFFQDGIGPKPIDQALIRGDVIENLDANIEIIDRWEAWQKVLFAEAEILMSEWKQFVQAEASG